MGDSGIICGCEQIDQSIPATVYAVCRETGDGTQARMHHAITDLFQASGANCTRSPSSSGCICNWQPSRLLSLTKKA